MQNKSKTIFKKASVLSVMTLTLLCVTILSGCTQLSTPTPTPTTVNVPTFIITPSITAGDGVLSDDKTQVTIPFYANTTSHTIKTGTNSTWVNPVISFAVKPFGGLGSTTIDLGTLHYQIENPSQTVGSSGNHYMLNKSGGNWRAIWTGDGAPQYVSGDSQIPLSENRTIVLTLDIDKTGMSYVSSTFIPNILTVRFTNGNGWSFSMTISFYATKVGASTT